MDMKKKHLINKILNQGRLLNEDWVVIVESYTNTAHRLAEDKSTTIGNFRHLIADGKIDHIDVVCALNYGN